MIPILESALALGTEVMKYVNTAASRKYIEKVSKLRRNILEEEDKGDCANDARIEHLTAELKIALDAAKQEITLEVSK